MKRIITIFVFALLPVLAHGAIVTRYFSTAAAGDETGSSWANRAVLFTGGAWSTVITGFDFSGSDSLKCLIGPGTHTVSVTMASGLFTNPPTAANPLIFHGCDSSGNQLAPPNPDWNSCEPAWDASGLPVIATTTNIGTTSLVTAIWRLLKFTASGRNGSIMSAAATVDWIVADNSTANTAATTFTSSGAPVSNSVLKATGSSYSTIVQTSVALWNVRIEGVTGSSGNRRGVEGSSGTRLTHCTIVNCGGYGFVSTSVSTSQVESLYRCIVANNGGGVLFASTAAQTGTQEVEGCMITGNGLYGIDAQSEARVFAAKNRLRDNASDNFNALDNHPLDLDNYTTDSDDASEYVSTGADGDFTIKNTATIWGMGFGVSNQAAAGGGGQRSYSH